MHRSRAAARNTAVQHAGPACVRRVAPGFPEASGLPSAAPDLRPPACPGTTCGTRLVRVAALCLALLLMLTPSAQAQTEVPEDWALIPSGLSAGDSFRLLFLSSTKRKSGSGTISVYNTFIEDRAANGHTAIQGYSSGFKAVGSTASVDARDNTATNVHERRQGRPHLLAQRQQGRRRLRGLLRRVLGRGGQRQERVRHQRTQHRPDRQPPRHRQRPRRHRGVQHQQRLPRPRRDHRSCRQAQQLTTGYGPLSSTNSAQATANRPFYGLSEVFTVADTTPPALESAEVSGTGTSIILTFDENLERVNQFDSPDEAAFTVKADGVEVVVTNTTPTGLRGVNIFLSGSIKQGQTVTVSYDKDDAGTQPIRDAAGNETLTFTDQPVTNNSTVAPVTLLPVAQFDDATYEGLEFLGFLNIKVTLDAAASGTVTVVYSTADGTATAPDDYTAVTDGSVSITTGDTEAAIRISITDDNTHEETETFSVTLTSAQGATLGTNVVKTVSIVDDDNRPPGPPLNLSATPGDDQVTLSWDPPANANALNVDIGDYQYRYKTDGDYSGWTTVSGGDAARSVTVPSLTNGTPHTFQVRAENRGGSPDGEPAEVTATPTATAPGPPQTLEASAGDAEVTLSWLAPSSDGGATITSYQYRYKTTGNYSGWSTVNGGGAARSVTVSSLANGTPHTFQVRAVNSAGDGTASTATATPTGTTTGPAAPRNLTTMAGNARVTLAWTKGDDGGSTITKHQIQQKEGSAAYGDWMDIPDSAAGQKNQASHIVTGLTNSTDYAFQVRAVNDESESDASVKATATPMAVSPLTVSVTITAAEIVVDEGRNAEFTLLRSGNEIIRHPVPLDMALEVELTVSESGDMLHSPVPQRVTFPAGAARVTLTVQTVNDGGDERDSVVTVTVGQGTGYEPVPANAFASMTVRDNDRTPPPPGGGGGGGGGAPRTSAPGSAPEPGGGGRGRPGRAELGRSGERRRRGDHRLRVPDQQEWSLDFHRLH